MTISVVQIREGVLLFLYRPPELDSVYRDLQPLIQAAIQHKVADLVLDSVKRIIEQIVDRIPLPGGKKPIELQCGVPSEDTIQAVEKFGSISRVSMSARRMDVTYPDAWLTYVVPTSKRPFSWGEPLFSFYNASNTSPALLLLISREQRDMLVNALKTKASTETAYDDLVQAAVMRLNPDARLLDEIVEEEVRRQGGEFARMVGYSLHQDDQFHVALVLRRAGQKVWKVPAQEHWRIKLGLPDQMENPKGAEENR